MHTTIRLFKSFFFFLILFTVVEEEKRGKGFSHKASKCEKEDRLWVCPSLLVLSVSLQAIFAHATGPCSHHSSVKQIKLK